MSVYRQGHPSWLNLHTLGCSNALEETHMEPENRKTTIFGVEEAIEILAGLQFPCRSTVRSWLSTRWMRVRVSCRSRWDVLERVVRYRAMLGRKEERT